MGFQKGDAEVEYAREDVGYEVDDDDDDDNDDDDNDDKGEIKDKFEKDGKGAKLGRGK